MLAVIKTGGKQYLVSSGQKIKVEKLTNAEKETVAFDEILLLADEEGQEVKIGQPFLKSARVEGMVLKQARRPKVIVFKYKPKKRYQVKKGHRQSYTEVEIQKIGF